MSEIEQNQGWDCITEVFSKKYPDQENPLHFGTLRKWRLGGNDPLDGISIYDGGDYYHFVTYGLSELHEKESEDLEYSGYGFELTVKLKKSPKVDEQELKGMAGVLQSLTRYVFEGNVIFQPYEYIYTGQESGMDTEGTSNITGFITIPDEAGVIHTPNGKVEFVQLIGMTDRELKALVNKEYTVKELLDKLSHDITDYNRKELI
ncbi:suppressor of fused domain protein [Shimazuella kribbensis]|uniref:suppressor of fused domain protein n=1 Tax=Shimazuella kribbensis TaxID=139808 RepID=UPI0003FD08B2|nr:suppressor of fused domain protein [Shimazuella kribbensis]